MKELLAIDAGNTNVKYALFRDGEMVEHWRHELGATEEMVPMYLSRGAAVAMACVAPTAGAVIMDACARLKRPLLHISANTQKYLTGMNETMGADRVADAVAAWKLYGLGKRPVILMGFGTATTLLAITAEGHVAGGWIAPGGQATLEVLNAKCQLLPMLNMEGHSDALGFDTESHMRNGVFLGQVGTAREWLAVASRALGSGGSESRVAPISVATGGGAYLIQDYANLFDHVDKELTLKGVYLIAEAAVEFDVPIASVGPTEAR